MLHTHTHHGVLSMMETAPPSDVCVCACIYIYIYIYIHTCMTDVCMCDHENMRVSRPCKADICLSSANWEDIMSCGDDIFVTWNK